MSDPVTEPDSTTGPGRSGLVLAALILVAAVAILIGAAIVFVRFPRRAEEQRLLARYHQEDTAQPDAPATSSGLDDADAVDPRGQSSWAEPI